MAYTTIDDPSAYFQTAIYTGNGSSNAITFDGNSDMQPDFFWGKCRSTSSGNHLQNSTTGVKPFLVSNSDAAENTDSNNTDFLSYDSDGFTLGTSYQTDINHDTRTYVAWNWKANGGTTTSNGASGDIKASVTQREDTAKFSICTYTGTGINAGQSHRVNHGLGTTPHVMLFKNRGAGSTDWVVYHHRNTAAPETDYLVLNSTAATVDSANKFNDTAPNTSYATIGGDDNISSNTMVLYSFAEVQGYSKFGSYTGNGDADGTFVYTGFKPSFIICKATSTDGDWKIFDNKRISYNGANYRLSPNTSGAETTDSLIDILSNGFKLKTSSDSINGSGNSVIYIAFAESPFVSSKGVPTTAR